MKPLAALSLALALLGTAPALAEPGTPAPQGPKVLRPPPALPDSLMFSSNEVLQLTNARRGVVTVEQGGGVIPALTLAGAMVSGPQDWTLWVNGRRLVPGTKTEGYEVVQVTERWVEFKIDGMDTPVRLQPNQTYLPARGAIIEGSSGIN